MEMTLLDDGYTNVFQTLRNWTIVCHTNSVIAQISKDSFTLNGYYHNEALGWIENECSYNYEIWTERDTRKIHLQFIDITGAVEFKLRFINV